VRLHNPDIILLDLSLPGRTGVDLLPDIRALNDKVRILNDVRPFSSRSS